ncbi:MAG: hypothetical protein K6G23_07570 [Lachnospiraceae bacterium]|nr:hypothetical protein [Lachnospiraceae bacterium]
MEKANVKLSGIIGRYLLGIIALLGIVTLIAGAVVMHLTTRSADDTEQQIVTWLAEGKESGVYDPATLPQNADYLWEADGAEILVDIHVGSEEKLRQYASVYKTSGAEIMLDGQEVYRGEVLGDGEILFIHYSLAVPGEWIALFMIVLAYVLAILVPSVVLIAKLKRLIYHLAEEKWRKEYENSREMAQIAHDLKTPLTVIRGNADLLLETDVDDEQRESIETIIHHAERIARSVLDILERDHRH